MTYEVWTNYNDLNADLKEWGVPADEFLDNDKNAEDPSLIVGVGNFVDDGTRPIGPHWPIHLGYDLAEHVKIQGKYDLFIYTQ